MKAATARTRSRLIGAWLLGSLALWACSGNDTGVVPNSKLEADGQADNDATLTGDEGTDDAAEEPLTDTTLVGDEDTGDATEEPTIDAEPDAGADSGDAEGGDGGADAKGGDGGADATGGEGDADVKGGEGDADAKGGEGDAGPHVDSGDAHADADVDSEDAGVGADSGDADAAATCIADLDAAVDGGLSMTAQIVVNLQGDACEQCAAMYCLDPGTTCESFGCQVATAGPAAGTLKRTLCYQTLSCLLAPTGNPIPCYEQGNQVQACYCGVESSSVCETTGPTATAECALEEQAADESDASATVMARLTDASFAGGVANNIMDCLSDNCLDCLP